MRTYDPDEIVDVGRAKDSNWELRR